MRKRKKLYILLIAIITIFLIPMSVVVARQISGEDKLQLRWTKPPVWTVENEQKPDQRNSNNANNQKLFDVEEKNRCLGYLDYYRTEVVTGREGMAEAERINKKNALMQKYKTYVNSLYNQVMTIDEYNAHFDYLMEIVDEMLPLEPEKTSEEQLEIDIRCLLIKLEEELLYSEIHGEWYISHNNLNVAQLKESIKMLKSLQNKMSAQKLTGEQSQQEYAACLEDVKTACPAAYANATADEATE